MCCGRNVRGSSLSTSVVPLSNQVTTLNHKRFKGFKMFSDGHSGLSCKTTFNNFRAFDAKTGKILWEFPTISGVAAVPVSFQVDGKPYISVQSGWGVDPAKMQARMDFLFPSKYSPVPPGGAVS